MRRQMILWVYLLITSIAFAQRPPECLQAGPFTINYDSVKITVQSWPNKLVVINQIENRKSVLVTEYLIKNNTIVQAKTALKHLSEPNPAIDSNLFEVYSFLRSKTTSRQWSNENVELELETKEKVLNTILSVNGNQNVFELEFFIDSSCLTLVSAQDRSQRYVDSLSLNNKYVEFITRINKKQKLGKNNYWINGYLFSFSNDQFEKIKGKKVKISGQIIIIKRHDFPYYKRLYSPDGSELIRQPTIRPGPGKDVMKIVEPKIEILKN